MARAWTAFCRIPIFGTQLWRNKYFHAPPRQQYKKYIQNVTKARQDYTFNKLKPTLGERRRKESDCMKKSDRKRVSKDGLELAAQPEASGPPGEASKDDSRELAHHGGGPPGETFPGIDDLADHIKPKRKRVMISIRLDAEVLSWYRSRGKGYQSYIGELLAAWKRQQESQTRT